jgi:hypothetical protein
MLVSIQNGSNKTFTDASTLAAWTNPNVLGVYDTCIIRNCPGQTDQGAVFLGDDQNV